MKVVHDWLKEYIGDDAPSASEVADLLTFHAFEIDGVETVGEKDVIDVDVLPNRAADCLSHRGIARELASLTGRPLARDPLAVSAPELPTTDRLRVTVPDTTACPYFSLALIEGVKVGSSPEWLRARLEALGQRSINNVVDATNYVMFGLGQPTHVYDADKFDKEGDAWHFGVRMAEVGKKVTTLGGLEYEVDEAVQVITNEATGAYAGLAGIKGGAYAELTSDTTTVIVEAGNFNSSITRKAGQKLRLKTDASKRYENGVTPRLAAYGLASVVELILDIAGGELVGSAVASAELPENTAVPVTLDHANALLGLTLTPNDVEGILERLGFMYTATGDGAWNVAAPFERTDITIAEDVIEEVGRVYGYDNVASVAPDAVPLTEYNERHIRSEQVRAVLTSLGFSEVITSSFRKKDDIQLANALASDKSCLRSSLIKNIAETLDKNASLTDLLGTTDTRVFEIGTVFTKTPESVTEHTALALGVRLRASGYTGKEDKLLAEALASLEAAFGTTLTSTIEKGVAEINFTELIGALPAVAAYETVPEMDDVQYAPFSTYPSISRDIALWVSEGTAAVDVEEVLNAHAGELRARTTLFDEFTKDGRTSFAFRLVFQSKEKTLTDEEVHTIMDGVYTAVSEREWEVR